MKKLLITLLVLSNILFAQSAGNSGLSFLKIGFGARNLAMSDLGVVGPVDVTAYNYNPALLSKMQSSQIFIGHNAWIQDVSSQMLGASFEMFGLPFAFGMNTTNISDIEVRTRPGDVESKFSAHYFFSSLSTGFNVYDKLSFGFTLKYLYENLYSDEAGGFGYDFGLHYSDIVPRLNFGLSLRNLGSIDKLRSEPTKLPTDLRAGFSYLLHSDEIESDLTLLAGYQKYTETSDTHIHLGAELFYKQLVALRMGYMTGYEAKGFTVGLGILWNDINFDYAFIPYEYDLGSSHTISLGYSFN